MKLRPEKKQQLDYATAYRRDRPNPSLSHFRTLHPRAGPERPDYNLRIDKLNAGSEGHITPKPRR